MEVYQVNLYATARVYVAPLTGVAIRGYIETAKQNAPFTRGTSTPNFFLSSDTLVQKYETNFSLDQATHDFRVVCDFDNTYAYSIDITVYFSLFYKYEKYGAIS